MTWNARITKEQEQDIAAVTAAKADILNTRSLLGVAGTYNPGDPFVNRAQSRYNAGNLVSRISFDATAKLTDLGIPASVVVSLDSENTLHAADMPGVSLKFAKTTAGTSAEARHTLAAPTDVNHNVMVLRFYLHPGAGVTAADKLSYVEVTLFDHTHGYVSTHKSVFKIWVSANLATTDANGVSGWYCIPVCLDCPTSIGGTAAATLTEIEIIKIVVVPVADMTANIPIITLDAIEFYTSPFAAAWYSIRIDSGTTNALDMAESLKDLSVKATFAIQPGTIGTTGYMTFANLVTVQGWGHQLALYSGDYPTWTAWASKTEAQKRNLLSTAAAWCLANGLPVSLARTVCASGGSGFIPHDRLLFQEARIKQFGGLDGSYAIATGELETAFRPEVMHTGYFIDVVTGDTTPAAVTALIALAATAKLGISLGSHIATANQRATLLSCVSDLQTAAIVNKTWPDLLVL